MPNPSPTADLPVLRRGARRQEEDGREEGQQRRECRDGAEGPRKAAGQGEAEAQEEGLTERIKIAVLQRLLASPSGGWRISEMTSTHAALPALIRLALAALDEYELIDEPSEELEEAIAAFDFTGVQR